MVGGPVKMTPLLVLSSLANNFSVHRYKPGTVIVCQLEIIDSECFFFSIMQGVTVLVVVFMWCTQTVHVQGQ